MRLTVPSFVEEEFHTDCGNGNGIAIHGMRHGKVEDGRRKPKKVSVSAASLVEYTKIV